MKNQLSVIGLAEAMSQALLLKLSTRVIYPSHSYDSDLGIAAISIAGAITYNISLLEDGRVRMGINGDYVSIIISEPQPIEIYNPDVVLDKIMKVIDFISDIGKYIHTIDDINWIAHGINNIINSSNKIITKQNKWNPHDNLFGLSYDFKSQFMYEFTK